LGGVPLLSNGQSGVAYPVRIVLALLVSPLANHDLLVVIHVFLSGLFMFLLLKEYRVRLVPALLAASAWMFASWTSGLMQDEVTLIATTWLAAALLLIHRAARTRSWCRAVAAGVPLGLMALGGQLQYVAIAFAVCGAYALALALHPPDRRRVGWHGDWTRLAYPVLTLGVGAALAAVTLLPTALNLREGGRVAPSYNDFVHNHTMPLGTFQHVFSGASVSGVTLFYDGMYVGIVPLCLAFIGFLTRRPGASLGRWLAVGTFLVAIGFPVVTWLAYYLVPGTSRLSLTGQAMWLFDFGVILLAAIGLDALLDGSLRVGRRLQAHRSSLRTWVPGLALLLAVAAVVATSWQLMNYGWYLNPPFTSRSDTHAFFPTTPAIAVALRDRSQRSAVDPQRLIGFGALAGDESAVLGLEDADGYDSVTANRVRSLWYVVEGASVDSALTAQHQIAALGFRGTGSSASFITSFSIATTRFALLPRLGITTVMTHPTVASQLLAMPRLASPLALQPIYIGGDASVFKIAGDTPRAWVVHEAEGVTNAAAALRRFTTPSFDYRHRMVVEPGQGVGGSGRTVTRGSGAGVAASRTELTPNGTAFSVRSDTAGWLVMADMYAPGWQVTVNGHEAKLLRADYALRAVAIPAGHSQVRLRYRPPGVALGLVITGLTLISLLVGAAAIALPRLRRFATALRADAKRLTPSSGSHHTMGDRGNRSRF
jgi:hypothetical protein